MDVITFVHVTAGGAGLLAALPAALARKRRGLHTWAGRIFAACGALVAVTALALVARAPLELIGLGVLGVLTGIWSMGGWWIAHARPRLPGGWRRWHLNAMGSAVIGFVTAFAVQLTDGHLLAWVLPTAVGSVVIGGAMSRVRGAAAPLATAPR